MDKPTDPLELLREIEAFISFRLLGDPPTFEVDDMRKMLSSIRTSIDTADGRLQSAGL